MQATCMHAAGMRYIFLLYITSLHYASHSVTAQSTVELQYMWQSNNVQLVVLLTWHRWNIPTTQCIQILVPTFKWFIFCSGARCWFLPWYQKTGTFHWLVSTVRLLCGLWHSNWIHYNRSTHTSHKYWKLLLGTQELRTGGERTCKCEWHKSFIQRATRIGCVHVCLLD